MTSCAGVQIRRWSSEDRHQLSGLVATDVDALWQQQFHILHDPNCDQPFRRTLIAWRGEDLVGAATVAASLIHPIGSACAIEVAPAFRRLGIGTGLLQSLRNAFPQHFPLRTKVDAQHDAALGFLRKVGGREYQRALGETIALNGALMGGWRRSILTPGAIRLVGLNTLATEAIVGAFADLYVWTHQDWNPVGDHVELRRVLAQEVATLDRAVSVAALDSGGIVAVALAFPAADGVLEIVAETTRREVEHGVAILAATIARLCEHAQIAGWQTLVFDGHPTDIHLATVLDSMPDVRRTPLLLMEIP